MATIGFALRRTVQGSVLWIAPLVAWVHACSDESPCSKVGESCLDADCCEGLASQRGYSYDEAGHRSTSSCTCVASQVGSNPESEEDRCSTAIVGDGVCDDPSGTGYCENDPDDCSGAEPAKVRCDEICAEVAALACPADRTSYCVDSCYGNLSVDHRPRCRALWLAAYECGAHDDEKTCDAEGRSQIGATCEAAFSEYAAECAESP